MRVKDLIEALEDCNPEAEVLLGTQPNYPFEYSIDMVIERSDIDDDDPNPDTDSGDVLILEGSQLRYGSKAMWGVIK
jgi:hypothetical protein